MGKQYTKTITLDKGETITVSFYHSPASKGIRDKHGFQLDPDEVEDVEIDTVSINGEDITRLLSEEAFAEITEHLLEMESDDE